MSTCSENQVDARYGYNKAGDGLETVKLLVLYSVENRQPIAFAKQPGNIPDVPSLANALAQLQALGVRNAEVLTGNGFFSEDNLAKLLLAGFRFITIVKTSIVWVRSELDLHLGGMAGIGNRRAGLGGVYCHTVALKRAFSKERKYASNKKGLEKGSCETFERRVYLHIYFDPARKEAEDASFYDGVDELKKALEEGVAIDTMAEAAQKKASKLLTIKKTKGGKIVSVAYNEEACRNACKYRGCFALVANWEKDRFKALEKNANAKRWRSISEWATRTPAHPGPGFGTLTT
ncbi:MAG: transposase [Eubacteriaceae bacterium]|nr:transposase [Eubacteriaceae bacterium]